MVTEDSDLLGLRYQITNRTAINLAEIARIDEKISQGGFTPRIIKRVKKESLTKSAHYSTKIEGNVLTLDQVKSLMDGRDVIAERRSIDEVKNYIKVLEDIDSYGADLSGILRIHRDISKGVLESPLASGKLREIQNYVVKGTIEGRREIVYTPPPPEKVRPLIEELTAWIEEHENEIHQVIQAGICHYAIAMIHPFEDGNGRVARALATLILRKRGFDRRGIYAMDEYYVRNLDEYYGSLRMVEELKGDMTQWLEYYTAGVRHSVSTALETMQALEKAAGLNTRQQRVLKHVIKHGHITNSEYRKITRVSKVTAYKDLKGMVDNGILVEEGVGRGVRYVMLKTGLEGFGPIP